MEETKATTEQNELDTSASLQNQEWTSFKHMRNGFKSKSHVKRSFLNEYSTNLKKSHLKRRKSLKTIPSFEESRKSEQNFASFSSRKCADPIYQTAIPNSVSFTICRLFLTTNRSHTAMMALEPEYTTVASQMMVKSSLSLLR